MNSRQEMIDTIRAYGLRDPKVLAAMYQVPREDFVPIGSRSIAFEDKPVDIGFGQTMSQPYTVAFMTSLLNLKGNEKVLEIGTGSGYQSAILSILSREVYSIEIISELAESARERLKNLGYKNVYVKIGSGEWGWPEKAPFDRIIVTAGIKGSFPHDLFDQLKVKGILVAPVGKGKGKTMYRFTKNRLGVASREKFGLFHFVPFVKEAN